MEIGIFARIGVCMIRKFLYSCLYSFWFLPLLRQAWVLLCFGSRPVLCSCISLFISSNIFKL